IAISESQERMAIVVREKDVQKLIDYAHAENLDATLIAKVTDTNRLVMNWRGKKIVDISREFIDTNGAYRNAEAHITCPAKKDSPLAMPLDATAEILNDACCCDNNPEQKFAKIEKAWYTNMKQLATCSQRGLSERFDGSIGASSVLFPFGGKYQATPESGCAAKIPVNSPCETETTSLMTFGYDPRIAQWSPYHGAQTSVLYSLARIIALGGNPETCRLTFQEYFERTSSKEAWGKPAAALLGALSAQTQMKTASIGGKDSMSGTFGDITVPPTLVSFAVTTENCKNINGGSFKEAGNKVYFVPQKYTSALTPDFADFTKKSEALYELNKAGKISAMYPVGAGGIADSLTKMAFGNRIGVQMTDMIGKDLKAAEPVHAEILEGNGHTCGSWMLFCPLYGAMLVEVKPENAAAFEAALEGSLLLGETIKEQEIRFKKAVINLADAEKEWESVLAKVFPPIVEGKDKKENVPELPEFALGVHKSLSDARKNPSFNIDTKAKPRVFLPVFPGTNCELDMERAFKLAGADTKVMVIRNKNPQMLEESLKEMEAELKKANILALSGGFSAGDEPDGSAKFIANILKEGRVSNEVMNLIKNRDGLILGICNGFQALIKTGLVPYGEIREMDADCPTLTYNNIGRHISRISRTRIVSAATPWAMHSSVIDERNTLVAISHGEGRIVVSEDMAKQLFANGQVFTQYVNENGIPVMTEPDNPNGSAYAIEGLLSPDGHVLGKMGHNERSVGIGANGSSDALFKNVAYDPMTNVSDNSCMNVFRAGVLYFK
ncbi:MAG: phosphoribosylformylglycinamidine synthase subunit PurQ, partial [Treponema sp.]|nr:phosphoribosylformylglycinamidine synthase subunit PurQ [Treponema sp.]